MEGQVEINKEAGRKGADGVSETARYRIRACLWILTILTCVMIFAFSSQDGDTSMETSGLFAEPIARAIARLRPDMTQTVSRQWSARQRIFRSMPCWAV